MDVDDSPTDWNDQDDDRISITVSFKSFHLLNALSDLLMLPKDMLLEKSIRKEVCPYTGTSISIGSNCYFATHHIPFNRVM